MPAYGERRAIRIKASPQACFDALTDFERLPTWQGAVREARVLERDDVGRGSVVAYEIDAGVRRLRYTLAQDYDEPHRLGSRYLGGDFRDFRGGWHLLADGSFGTRAELDVRIDPGRLVPGPVRNLISRAVVQRALRDLKTHLERTHHGAQ
jgi:ribosome-associated toxin RatA of RatAB toxin-antitoxin module